MFFLSVSWMGLLRKNCFALLLVRLLLLLMLQTWRGSFVGSLFDAVCKFVAEAGSADFFMIDGDVN